MKLNNISRAGGVVVPELGKQEAAEESSKEDLTCPVTACQEQFVRSVHLKRHLTGTHKIQNPLVISEAEKNQTHASTETNSEEGVRVPPLKIKLNQNEATAPLETVEEEKDEKTEVPEEALVITKSSPVTEEESVTRDAKDTD